MVNFLLSKNVTATDLHDARANESKNQNPDATPYAFDDLVDELNQEFGENAVARGQGVFVENCARCHSSTADDPPSRSHDFRRVSVDTGLREDFLGNDEATLVSEVGTYTCRALHSNHVRGHVWEEFASLDYLDKPADPNIKDPNGGGRGYYRNISLINLWAHAPFMHNNGLGPELCGQPGNDRNNFYGSPYVDADGGRLQNPPACWPYDPSVEGRYTLYKASMKALLNPDKRVPKITRLKEDIVIDLGPKLWDGNDEKSLVGLTLLIPEGRDVAMMGNFQHKPFIVDMVRSKTRPDDLKKDLTARYGNPMADNVFETLTTIRKRAVIHPDEFTQEVRKHLPLLLEAYSSCTADVENTGHRFGEDLSEQDKNALVAFLATL